MGNNNAGNFEHLMKLSAKVDPRIASWMKKKGEKYLHHDTQNEIIRLMAFIILRDIAKNINDSIFYSIMANEVTDYSNKEQFVICFRWVDKDSNTLEDFNRIYNSDNIKADTLVTVIKDVLIKLNIPLSNVHGQCYDGAKNLCGIKNGVSNKILSENPKAFFTHSFGHALNLAVGDMVKNVQFLKDGMDATYEISNLIKKSPKRYAILQKIRKNISLEYPGFKVLCPTRWTVRAESVKSILDNWVALKQVWDESLDRNLEPAIKSRIIIVKSQMTTFDYFYGETILQLVLRHSDIK